MRNRLKSAVLALMVSGLLAGCGGGGSVGPVATLPRSTPTPSGNGQAAITIAIVVPPASFRRKAFELRRRAHALHRVVRPRYVSPGTSAISVGIVSQQGQQFPTLQAQKQSCAPSGSCTYTANDNLPSGTYTLTITATDANNAILSYGTFSVTIVPGPNPLNLTLDGVVANAVMSPSGVTLQQGVQTPQVVPLTVNAVDADGFTIVNSEQYLVLGPGGKPVVSPLYVTESEFDTYYALSLQPSGGNAHCGPPVGGASGFQCALNSSNDTVALSFNGQGSDSPGDPNYFPAEGIITASISTSPTVSATNTVDAYSGACVTPQPVCVYYRDQAPLLEQPSGFPAPYDPTLLAIGKNAAWTDAGRISFSSPPKFETYGFPPSQGPIIYGLTYDPSSDSIWFPTAAYSGPPSLFNIPSSLQPTGFTYPRGKGNSIGAGENIVFGPDGNLWWIDPTVGILRYAPTSNPTNAAQCPLDIPNKPNILLSAEEIAPSPLGASAGRMWFVGYDNNTGNSYIGYVSDSKSGQNSCPNVTVGQLGGGSSGFPPNGLTVDANGNAWFDDGNATDSVGEAKVNGDGSVTVTTPVPVPAKFQVITAYQIQYDSADGNMYLALDSGLIGRFSPQNGPASTVAYAVPPPIAPPFANSSFPPSAPNGPGGAELVLQGGNGPGLLWFVGLGTLNVAGFAPPVTFPVDSNAVIGFDLSQLTFNASGPPLRPRFHPLHRHARLREVRVR